MIISLLYMTPPSLAQLLLPFLLSSLLLWFISLTTPSPAPTHRSSPVLQEVTVVVGELADRHLAVGGASDNAGSLKWCGVQAVSRHPLRTVPAGHMCFWQPVGQPRRVGIFLDPWVAPRGLAWVLLSWVGHIRTQAMAHEPAAESGIPTQQFAEVRLEDQVDQRVVESGGLGKDGRYRKSYGWDLPCAAKCCPHGDQCIGTPCRQEANAHSHWKLGRKKRQESRAEISSRVFIFVICNRVPSCYIKEQ